MSHLELHRAVAAREIGATLAAHTTMLADAGVPVVIAGDVPAERRDRLAAAVAAASPLPVGTGSAEIKISADEPFTWLADPTGVGCLVAGAGAAPRSPRTTRLVALGLAEHLDPATTRTVIRSLVRGFPLVATAPGRSLAEMLDRLRGGELRLPEDDLHRLGAVVVLDRAPEGSIRVASAHLMRPPTLDGGARRPPMLLATSNADGTWDDYAWAALPELAERVGFTQGEYSQRLRERERLLAAP